VVVTVVGSICDDCEALRATDNVILSVDRHIRLALALDAAETEKGLDTTHSGGVLWL
jgi:hypothetical protein